MVRATNPLGIGRYASWLAGIWLRSETRRFAVRGWPE